MTRAQALTLGVLTGFVILVFTAIILLVAINPIPLLFAPTPTPVLPTPTPTATPTFPNFMPTAGPTSTPAEPTPTSTRVPTVTPRPPGTPEPTLVINLPTRRPTATPPPPTAGPATPANTPILPTPTFAILRQQVSFEADETELINGDCTNLRWEVVGAVSVLLDNRDVEPEGKKEVCPDNDTEYRLTVQFPDQARLERKTVQITVKDQATTPEKNDNEDGD